MSSWQPRLLLEAEHVHPCGYAPRALLQSEYGKDCERMFVGCKDGSLAVTERVKEGRFQLNRLIDSRDIRPRAVRVLCELDEKRLFVGRSDGTVELVNWSETTNAPKELYRPPRNNPENAVRCIRQLGELWLLSWRSHTQLFTWDEHNQELQPKGELLARYPDSSAPPPLRGVRLAVRNGGDWLLATSRGELWIWKADDGTPDPAVPTENPWPLGATPGFIDSFVVSSDRQGSAQTILLATDLGVYGIDLATEMQAVRLSLPGLGAVCMALSTVSVGPVLEEFYDFLWAADAQDNSHLFWKKSTEVPTAFRPSGVVHIGSQAMLALSWVRSDGSIVFAQARRNDTIAFSEYTVVAPEGQHQGTQFFPSELQDSGHSQLRKYRDLLLYGPIAEIQEVIQSGLEEDHQPDTAYTVLADFFEFLAFENSYSQRALKEFLSNPSAVVGYNLLTTLTGDDFEMKVETAVRLWVLTLLGMVNRMQEAGETPYLGVIRWLRDLEFQAKSDKELADALAPALRKAIRFTGKWGLFGKANAQRFYLARPLAILRSQLSDQKEGEIGLQSEAIDLLTYESLLFHRSSDVLHEDSQGQMRGRSAWDLTVLEDHSQQFVAISWMWGGVELYEAQSGQDRAVELDFHCALIPSPEDPNTVDQKYFRKKPDATLQEKHGYSRAILLGRVNGFRFLLTAPTLEGRSSPERLHLYSLGEEKGPLKAQECNAGQDAQLEAGESVYRFLELEPGRILAGLRGIHGRPRLALLVVETTSSGGFTLTRTDFELRNSGAGSETTLRNRIWSLARAIPRSLRRRDEFPGRHLVAAGCESGEVLTFELPHGVTPQQLKSEIPAERIAQMSSPVVSLAYLSGYRTSTGEPTDRIFAGGEDGAIVAWQRHADPMSKSNSKDKPKWVFSSLWSTVEQGPIAAIHPLPYGRPGPEQEPQILVVTRPGRCSVFDDRHDLAVPSESKAVWQPQRPRFPGKRLRRSFLGGTAFASQLLCRMPPAGDQGESVWNEETGRYALLLMASEQGKIRLVTLHYPLSVERKKQFHRIVDLWWRIANLDGRYDLLRLVDAVYQAVPLLPLLLVRWILEPDRCFQAELEPCKWQASDDWKMPRYLRPLLELQRAWEKRDARSAADALERLLLHAWRLEDLPLFQQICAVTLKRANFDISKAAEASSGKDDEELCTLILAVFQIIEQSLQRWLGDPKRDARARIVVAKNLVDGDTFLRVLRRAHQEEQEEGPFHRILRKRIEGVRQLVFKHDSLVSLETFRALNLSLMRLCRRLVGTQTDDGKREEVAWSVFSSYFEALTYAAARTFRSRIELNDSLAHEYCRTFALAVFACPSAATRIANRMTETQLISDPDSDQDLSRRVLRQFGVLAQIGLEAPDFAVRLFRMASCPREKELNPVKPALKDLGLPEDVDHPEHPLVKTKVGKENAEDLFCLCRLYRVVDWFVELGERLSTDAKGIDLTQKNIDRLKLLLQGAGAEALEQLYSHSVDFWLEALGSLEEFAPKEPSKDTIRPEMILLSSKLADWAGERLRELDKSYRDLDIFQPEYPIFREVLARLERAAKDFPMSAAVQKNLVVAVFGHHLLEDLDEHVFELEELAQNLDPLMVWTFRDQGRIPTSLGTQSEQRRENGPVAQRFAKYLLRRASHAESIPKNLRSLYGILESPPSGKGRYPLDQLLKPFEAVGWKPEGGPGQQTRIEARVFQFLSLTLAELESNNQKHSGLTPKERKKYKPAFSYPERYSLEIRFWFRWDPVNVQRLRSLQRTLLQNPLPPREKRDVASTGAGLYLANLAASVVNWRLQLSKDKLLRQKNGFGICKFELFQDSQRRAALA